MSGLSKGKKLGIGVVSLVSLLTFTMIVSHSGESNIFQFSQSKADSPYSLTLNSDNKVTSNGDAVQHTARGGEVTFTYSNVADSTSGHVTLNENGSLVNKDIIHSITDFTVNFTGNLQARICYITKKWGDYFSLVSGKNVELGTLPYYLEIKAVGGAATIESAVIRYSCEVNSDAETQDTSGAYDITFSTHGSDGTSEIGASAILSEISSGSSYVSSITDQTKIFAGISGLKLGSKNDPGSFTININSTNVAQQITQIDIDSAQYGSDTGKLRVHVNGSNSYTEITPSAGGSVSVNATLTSLTIETSAKRAYLCGITLNYGGTQEPGTPEHPIYEVGFTASDANKDTYTTNSIFANDNALSVKKIMCDGTQTSLASNEYSYIIKNSLDIEINKNAQFPAEGVYTLVVSYSSYDSIEITLNVGEYVYINDVTAALTKVIYTTAETLSTNIASDLTATVLYSNDTTEEDIPYASFATYNLGAKLINPKGITHDITKPFGSAGTWTVKVYSLDDENIHYAISITVNAIQVETITLNETSYSLVKDDTLQLTTTINPGNATNDTIEWSTNNDAVATVSDTGLVTAVAVGKATITASAMDGSNVFATCSITVTAAPTTINDTLDRAKTGISGTEYNSWSNKTCTSTAVYAGQSAGGNDSIQLRSNNSNSGIVTTASGGKISKVTVAWNSNTATDRVLNIYGKSTAYSAATDLYGNNSGTLLGTIVKGTSTEFTVTGDYTFVGVRSSSGAMYLDSITFTWRGSQPTSPIYPESIEVSGDTPISVGQTSQLSVTYEPSSTNVKNVTYTSSNESVATVSSTGLVTGVAIGNATITATAEAADSGTVTDTFNITVSPIAVTSVSLDKESATVKVGKTIALIETISPSNASNKAVTWTSSDTNVATVLNGVVSGVAAGNATITVTTVDGSKTATCAVTVSSSAAAEESFTITYSDLPASYSTGNTIYVADSGIRFKAINCAGGYSSKMQFKASAGYLQSVDELTLQTITIHDRESNTLTVYGSNSADSFSTVINGTNDVYDLTGYSYFKIARTASGAAYCSSITVLTGTPTPTDPTSISLTPTSMELAPSGTKNISVNYTPNNANQNKEVTWTSSNTNVATVNSEGQVTAKSTATAGQTATITARLTNLTSIYATCTVTIIEQPVDDQTILIYMCGSNLESDYASQNDGLATGDIQEILSVYGQPDDVNIVIETGGANSWSSRYGISSTKLERWHVENRQLVKDDSLSYASMGLTSTLQSFVEYGLKNYPADRTGIIFWNHGGAMRGCCYDEKKNDDCLLTNEVSSAISGALSNCNMAGQKLEWVGYDCCLMQVQDIASINSDYFNYMVASEESESGYGWDYDTWVDDLYAKKTTPVILKAIVDGFISSNGGTSSNSNDQTLSYLNLSNMPAYITAWNNMATQLSSKISSGGKSSFNDLVKTAKHYADDDYTYYGIFDAKDFVTKLSNSAKFNPGSEYTNAVLTAFSNLVAYSSCGKGAGNSYGLCMFWAVSSNCYKGTYYTASMTKFTAWRTLVTTYGY